MYSNHCPVCGLDVAADFVYDLTYSMSDHIVFDRSSGDGIRVEPLGDTIVAKYNERTAKPFAVLRGGSWSIVPAELCRLPRKFVNQFLGRMSGVCSKVPY